VNPLGSSLGAAPLHALHWLTRAALRVQPPIKAKRTVDMIAHRIGTLYGTARAHRALQALQGRGSCLSRALTVASLVHDAEVVIGINRLDSARACAHAWVEIHNVRVDVDPPRGVHYRIIARMRPAHTYRRPVENRAIGWRHQ
jgi:hypothetical protein